MKTRIDVWVTTPAQSANESDSRVEFEDAWFEVIGGTLTVFRADSTHARQHRHAFASGWWSTAETFEVGVAADAETREGGDE